MKRKIFKLAAWMLCLGLVAGIIPMQGYNGVAQAADVEYAKGANEITVDFKTFGTGKLWDKKGELADRGWTLNSELGSTYYNWIQSGNPYKQNQFISGTGLDLNLMPSVGDAVFDFTVPADGYYKLSTDVKAYPNLSGKVQISFINGNERTTVGTVDMTGATTGDTYTKEGFTVPEYEMVYLNKGTCQLVLTGIQDVGMNKFLIEKLALTEVIPVEVGTTTKTLYFDLGVTRRTYLKDQAVPEYNGWTWNKELTTGTVLAHATSTDYRFAQRYSFMPDPAGTLINMSVDGDLALDFEIAEAGYYSLSAAVQVMIGNAGPVQFSLKNGDSVTAVGVINPATATGDADAWSKTGFEMLDMCGAVYLNEGTNQLILNGVNTASATTMYNTLLETVTLTKVTPVELGGDDEGEEPSESNFGSQYAYVRESYEDGVTSYEVIFIGGINEIDGYSQVGFEYSVDGGSTWKKALSQKVYDKLAFTGGELESQTLGAGYLFYQSVELTAADAAAQVQFRACAEKADATFDNGEVCTVTIAK